jgi:uncharacterized repeat protein (TIGR03803 family)
MRHSYRFVAAFLSAAILAACGGANNGLYSSTPLSVTRSQPALGPHAANRVTEKVLHGFTGGSDGAVPVNVILTDMKGVLYGTTEQGGGSGCQSSDGCGTVFKASTSGAESVLYGFKGGKTDGQYPKGGLIERSGVLYGTTQTGGANSAGTFFKITASGKETMLHSFGGAVGSGYDGVYPYARLIYVSANDMFYGTTLYGGSGSCYGGCGTVFSVTPSGKETVLHSFGGGQDGDFLSGSLLYSNGELYGTTENGGGGGGSTCSNTSVPVGCGTIFSVSTSGTEKVLYSFTGGSDGAYPDGGLIDVNGKLYGMAQQGGAGCGGGGCGTIFSLSASNAFHAIYSFQGPPNDGAFPWGNLTNVDGVLYGTTDEGGASTACTISTGTTGCGTVFRVTTSGKEQMLYSFEGSPDGAYANTSLLYAKGVFYGTTLFGGSGSCTRAGGSGCGTVFSLTTSNR